MFKTKTSLFSLEKSYQVSTSPGRKIVEGSALQQRKTVRFQPTVEKFFYEPLTDTDSSSTTSVWTRAVESRDGVIRYDCIEQGLSDQDVDGCDSQNETSVRNAGSVVSSDDDSDSIGTNAVYDQDDDCTLQSDATMPSIIMDYMPSIDGAVLNIDVNNGDDNSDFVGKNAVYDQDDYILQSDTSISSITTNDTSDMHCSLSSICIDDEDDDNMRIIYPTYKNYSTGSSNDPRGEEPLLTRYVDGCTLQSSASISSITIDDTLDIHGSLHSVCINDEDDDNVRIIYSTYKNYSAGSSNDPRGEEPLLARCVDDCTSQSSASISSITIDDTLNMQLSKDITDVGTTYIPTLLEKSTWTYENSGVKMVKHRPIIYTQGVEDMPEHIKSTHCTSDAVDNNADVHGIASKGVAARRTVRKNYTPYRNIPDSLSDSVESLFSSVSSDSEE